MNSFEDALRRAVKTVEGEVEYNLQKNKPLIGIDWPGPFLYGVKAVVTMMRLTDTTNPCWWFEGLGQMLLDKNRAYGKDNILVHGADGVRVRLDDKIARFMNLYQNRVSVGDETLVDTVKDTIGYTVVGLMLERDWWGLPYRSELVSLGERLARLEEGGV